MDYPIETCREPDGRWMATVPRIPGLIVYEQTREDVLITARKLFAILRDDAVGHDGRLLAFYPGRIPESLHPLSAD